MSTVAVAMDLPSDQTTFDHAPMDDRRDDRRNQGELADLGDVVDAGEAFDSGACSLDACHPGWLDLGCFDASDCGGGLDCVSFDCSF